MNVTFKFLSKVPNSKRPKKIALLLPAPFPSCTAPKSYGEPIQFHISQVKLLTSLHNTHSQDLLSRFKSHLSNIKPLNTKIQAQKLEKKLETCDLISETFASQSSFIFELPTKLLSSIFVSPFQHQQRLLQNGTRNNQLITRETTLFVISQIK